MIRLYGWSMPYTWSAKTIAQGCHKLNQVNPLMPGGNKKVTHA